MSGRRAVRVVAGAAPGAYVPLPDEPVTLGRSGIGAPALADDRAVADGHCRVSPLADGQLLVEDLGSPSGTWVDGRRIPAPTVVRLGEQFQVGGSVLEVVEAAPAQRRQAAAPKRELGGVQQVPGGLFEMIAKRAPVRREQVVPVFLFALGWAYAINLLIRTLAIDALDVPDDTNVLRLPRMLFATLMPCLGNTIGFYLAFRRPKNHSAAEYLIPTFAFTAVALTIVMLTLNNHDAATVVVTVVLTLTSPVLSTVLMLRLRSRVSREQVQSVRGG